MPTAVSRGSARVLMMSSLMILREWEVNPGVIATLAHDANEASQANTCKHGNLLT
jgi:hypothetical protein